MLFHNHNGRPSLPSLDTETLVVGNITIQAMVVEAIMIV